MEVVQARTGRPFTLALAAAVEEAKAGDSLEPVTVVVPSNTAGLSLRRLLGSGRLMAQPRLGPIGIANVGFATPFQLASRLAAPALAASGARPLTTAVLAAAVRHVLAGTPGRFARVADHVATETAVVRAYGELTELEPAQLAVLAAEGNERTRSLLDLVGAVREHLEQSGSVHHDEYAVMHAAIDVLRSGPAPAEHIVLAGPFGRAPAPIAFLATLAATTPTTAVVALTGDGDVDRDSVGAMAPIVGRALTAEPTPIPLPTALVPAADSDEEVRTVVADVLALAAAGQPFDRMAVFHPVADPYARTIREQFELASIPTAGADHRRLADAMVGRLVRSLLKLAPDGSDRSEAFERGEVMALIEAAPLQDRSGRPVRASDWERVSRRAGVVGGIDDWADKLERHIRSSRVSADDPGADRSQGQIDAHRRDADSAEALRQFVLWLHERSAGATVEPTWKARADWLAQLLADLLPTLPRRHRWPAVELDAADRIEGVLQRISVLDSVDPEADWRAFGHALELELSGPMGRSGRVGTGVLVAPLATSAGLDLDHVFVVGLSEGLCPRGIREDSLVPDAERELVGGALPRRSDRLLEERRRFLFAVGAAGAGCSLVTPTGDHRNGRTRTASRWWVEAVNALENRTDRSSDNWHRADVAELRPAASFVQALVRRTQAGLATSNGDMALQLVGADHSEAVAADLRRRLAMLADRRVGFNRFNGDLSTEDLPEVGGDKPISATRLETWAGCPRRYLFSQLLGLGRLDAPDLIEEISALDRGSLLHDILERFIAEALPDGPAGPVAPGDTWGAAGRARMAQVSERVFADYVDRGKTGRPLLWGIQREVIDSDLDRFLGADDHLRSEHQLRPDRVEMPIGFAASTDAEPTPPAEIELDSGRIVKLRGYADRVDLRADGSPFVLDYKTGRAVVAKHLEDDPVVAGTKLQLGVYAEAARQHYGTTRSAARYWYTSERENFKTAGYDWPEDDRAGAVRDRFIEAVATIIDGIEAGVFPPNPGEFNTFFGGFDNCRFCEFDQICDRDRDTELERAAASGRIEQFVSLSRPPRHAGEQP